MEYSSVSHFFNLIKKQIKLIFKKGSLNKYKQILKNIQTLTFLHLDILGLLNIQNDGDVTLHTSQ